MEEIDAQIVVNDLLQTIGSMARMMGAHYESPENGWYVSKVGDIQGTEVNGNMIHNCYVISVGNNDLEEGSSTEVFANAVYKELRAKLTESVCVTRLETWTKGKCRLKIEFFMPNQNKHDTVRSR